MANSIFYYLKRADKRFYLVGCSFLLALSFVVLGFSVKYYDWLRDTIKAESDSYLHELSQKSGDYVSKVVTDRFAMLETVKTTLQRVNIPNTKVLFGIIEDLGKFWNYESLLLIDDTGGIFDDEGRKITLAEGEYLTDSVVGRRSTVSSSQVINGVECIVFTIPVDNVFVGNTEIVALSTTFLAESFDAALSVGSFNGQAYAFLVNPDGTMAVPPASPDAVDFGYNVLTYLKSQNPNKTADIELMQQHIGRLEEGQLQCLVSGNDNYITYYPLNFQNWTLLTIVPVSVANAKTQELLVITLAFCIITMLLVTALVLLLGISFYSHKQRLERIAFVDPVTGGHTLQRFTILADSILKKSGNTHYALIYSNLEKFRIINEQLGRDAGDAILKTIDQSVSATLADDEALCHIIDDHFCVLVRWTDQESVLVRCKSWYNAVNSELQGRSDGLECPVSQFGVYIIHDAALSFTRMLDSARFAMNKLRLRTDGRLRYAIYDEKAHQRLLREKALEDRMERALSEGEFIIYLQPKYQLSDDTPTGAEALVRWNSKLEGMIYPDEFIPLFEQNGFIVQLDLYVFEQACKLIRSWIDRGLSPIRVSVNCSRVHLSRSNFLQSYLDVFSKYDIPASYLELELTESMVYEDTKNLSHIIQQIHHAGFFCSIDDFGSGYSSLNMIKDIEADVLKLDKIFFRSQGENEARGEAVVESIIRMAKALSMHTVAEGVESKEQVELLKRFHCDYIQGYVFAKPMPIVEFEHLLFPG